MPLKAEVKTGFGLAIGIMIAIVVVSLGVKIIGTVSGGTSSAGY